MEKRTNKKNVLFLLFTAIMAFAIMLFVMPNMDVAFASSDNSKNYCNATIADNFDPSSIILVLDKSLSDVNKIHDKNFFGDIKLHKIKDLTKVKKDKTEKIKKKDTFKQILKLELKKSSKENVLKTIKKLEKIDGVISAEPNYINTQDSVSLSSQETGTEGLLWGIFGNNGIDARSAWEVTCGNNYSEKIKVGIISSGIAESPYLNGNVVEGWDFINDNNVTNDDELGVGTMVAGIIGGKAIDSDQGFGISQRAELFPLQISNTITNNKMIYENADLIEAINWGSYNDLQILYFGNGKSDDSTAVKTAIQNFDGLFVCGAGNDTSNSDTTLTYPANYSNQIIVGAKVISVGAHNSQGQKHAKSNYGAESVSIFAPGEAIIGIDPTKTEGITGVGVKHGTEYAAAFVAGTAVLVYDNLLTLSEYRSMDLAELSITVKEIIMETATVWKLTFQW